LFHSLGHTNGRWEAVADTVGVPEGVLEEETVAEKLTVGEAEGVLLAEKEATRDEFARISQSANCFGWHT
jgi:hypothetical protein